VTLTFVDSGVLIAAVRGVPAIARRAIEILDDDQRSFASSDFVRLEVLPKPLFHKNSEEAAFYEAFFEAVTGWAHWDESLLHEAFALASRSGLSALDALHAAAALSIGAGEIVTTEKLGRPIHRIPGIRVTTIHPG
jgi:predicted nucleic acid-binding protein